VYTTVVTVPKLFNTWSCVSKSGYLPAVHLLMSLLVRHFSNKLLWIMCMTVVRQSFQVPWKF